MTNRESFNPEWPLLRLGEVCEFLDHLRKPVTESKRATGPFPYYGANGKQGSIDQYLFDEPLVLLAEDGGYFDEPHRGIAYSIDGKTWVNNHAHVLRPKPCVNIRYLSRVLKHYDVTPFISGSTRAKLTKSGAERILIGLPSLAEQQRIAAILDKAEALQAKRRQALDKLDTLAQSLFLEMFGDVGKRGQKWPLVRFKSIAKCKLGKMLDGAKQTGTATYPYIRNANVQWNKVDLSSLLEMDFDDKDRLKFSLEKGDLLICEGGEPGRAAVWNGEMTDCYYQKAIHRCRLDTTVATSKFCVFTFWQLAKNQALYYSTVIAQT